MLALPLLALSFAAALHAQGTLSVTPAPAIATAAGTGSVGYTGDAASAANATFAAPAALAYDTAGNLYIADRNNHVIRSISPQGIVTTVAGSGLQGFSGDGGPATAATLDTPSGIALDTAGNLYIADSHNHRIRLVSGGTITTIAGTGIPGFSGDGGPAVSAQLALPSAVALDAAGNLYIADTNNHRIRLIQGGVITTLAGDGEELFSGDGGPATAASLDSPTGIAVDTAGRVYIADRHNQRIRVIDTTGVISTLAGSSSSLSGAFAGDGAAANVAALARPTGVSVDASGNVYIADTGNQRIRQVTGGAISTIAGTGDQGFAGDGGPSAAAILNAPRAAITGPTGTLLIADTLNQRLRSSVQPTLTFTSAAAGIASAPQAITLANTGNAALTLASLAVSGSFATANGGTCSATPITLAPGANCTQSIAYVPTLAGSATGSVTVSGPGVVPQTILLAGTAGAAPSTASLTSSNTALFAGQPLTLTLTVASSVGATGAGAFYDGSNQIGTAALAGNSASITVTTLAVGTHTLTAVYSGDANNTGSTSGPITELIGNADFTIAPDPSGPTGGSTTQTIAPGQPAMYSLVIQPVAGPLTYPVTLSAIGLPTGATVTFSPQTLTVGASPVSFTMTVHTAPATAALHPLALFSGAATAMALMLLPFAGTLRRRAVFLRNCAMLALLLTTGASLVTLAGCGTGTGFFGGQPKTYSIQVIGTANGPTGATVQHLTTVQLILQ